VKVAIVTEYYPRAADPVLGVWAHRQALAARDAGADVRVLVLHRPLPSYAALDLAADVTRGNWTIRLFARNVTDRRAYIGGGLGVDADNVPYGIDLNALQPRTMGISVDVGF